MSLPVHDRTVLRLIESQKATSQIEIAKALHLRTNTVHGVIQKLLENGKIINDRTEIYGRGRPIRHYRTTQPSHTLAIAFIGSDIYMAVVHDQKVVGKVLERHAAEQHFRSDAFQELRRDFKEILRLSGVKKEKITGVVFAHGGAEIGERYKSSISPWLQEVTQKDFEDLFKLPVKVINKAALLAKMELRARMREGCHTLILFNLADGLSSVGSSYKNAWDNAFDFRGEMGHVVIDPNGPLCGCGNRGCLEALISGIALQKRIHQELQKRNDPEVRALSSKSGYELFEKLDAVTKAGGNAYADALLDEFLERCAWVVSLIVNLHNPDVIVMHGYAFTDRVHWLEEIHKRSKRYIVFKGENIAINLEFRRTDMADYLCGVSMYFNNGSED